VASTLSSIPVDKRKQLAATLGLFSVLFIAVGAVAATGRPTAVIRVFVILSLAVAVLLALIAWGVARSVRLDRVDESLDAAIEAVVAASPGGFGQLCDCGHEHDPTELHVTDDPCAQDGAGHDCTHSCDTCVLAGLRTAPVTSSAGRPRPGPGVRA
jgi:hypothetical protein